MLGFASSIYIYNDRHQAELEGRHSQAELGNEKSRSQTPVWERLLPSSAWFYITTINIKQSLKVGIPKRSLGTRHCALHGYADLVARVERSGTRGGTETSQREKPRIPQAPC
jgi:hypothetical protein